MSDHEHVLRNRNAWDELAASYVEPGRRRWADETVTWGVFNVPDTDLGMLPDVADKDVVELGCGTAYVSAWIARRGGRCIAVDNSAAQLATAAVLQDEFGLRFPLVQASAEDVPLADASFDVAISEYGASIWCDPYRWIPEAARLLRPGGELVFLVNGTLLMLCMPDSEEVATTTILRPYFGMHRFEWTDEESVDFHLGYGDWIRLLRANDFDIEDLIEVRPPAGATTTFPYVTPEWAQRWPSEEIWRARKR